MSTQEFDTFIYNASLLKITERRNSLDRLYELLSSNNIIKELQENKQDTWNPLFRSAHSLVDVQVKRCQQTIIEQKSNATKTIVEAEVNRLHTFILKILENAYYKGKKLIDTCILMSAVLEGLSQNEITEIFLNTHLSILSHILSENQHTSDISNLDWKNLIGIMHKLLNSFSSKNQKTILVILNSVVKSCPFYLLKDFHGEIETIWKLQEIPTRNKVEITHDYFNKIVKDCRIIFCNSGDKILFYIISKYFEVQTDSEIKDIIFYIFNLQIIAHNSINKSEIVRGPSNEWKKLLEVIYSTVKNEAVQSSCIKYLDIKSANISENFIMLGAEIIRQRIICDIVNDSNGDQPPPEKRMKNENFSLLTFINDLKPYYSLKWLYILQRLFQKYPDIIKPSEVLPLLQTFDSYLVTFKSNLEKQAVLNCLSELMVIEGNLKNTDNSTILLKLWNDVYDKARAMFLEQNGSACHYFLQNLMKYKKTIMFSQLSDIYLYNKIPFSLESVKTISILYQNKLLPEVNRNNENVKSVILKWIFNSDEENIANIYLNKNIAKFTVFLIIKTNTEIYFEEKTKSKDFCSELECLYSYLNFQNKIEECANVNSDKYNSNVNIHETLLNELLSYVEKQVLNLKFDNRKYITVVNQIIFLINIISELRMWNINANNIIEKLLLELQKMVKSLYKYSENELCKKIQRFFIIELLQNLRKIFEVKFDTSVSEILNNEISPELIQRLFDIMSDASDEKIYLEVYKLLFSFICLPVDKTLSIKQENVSSMLQLVEFDASDENDLKLADYNINCILSNSSTQNIEVCIKHYKLLCDYFLLKNRNVTTMLNYFYEMIPLCESNIEHRKHLVNIFKTIFELSIYMNSDNLIFLIKIIQQFHECDPSGTWTTSIIQEIPSFLLNVNLDVRIAVIKLIPKIFLCKKCSPTNKKLLFDLIASKLERLFNVDELLAFRDEELNRIATVLHTYASIAYSYVEFRSLALYKVIKLHFDKNISIGIINKIISSISVQLGLKNEDELISSNVNALFYYWKNDLHKYSSFPYRCLGCKDLKDFDMKYSHVLLLELLDIDDFSETERFCNTIGNVDMKELLKKGFSYIFFNIISSFALEENKYVSTYKKMEAILGDDISVLLINKLDEIIIFILELFYDPKLFKHSFSLDIYIPRPGPFYYNITSLKKIFEYLQINHLCFQTVILFAVENCPQKIEIILRKLMLNVNVQPTIEEKLRFLHAYTIFVDLILEDISNTKLKKFVLYILRDISFTLLYLIVQNGKDNESINLASCRYLHKFIKMTITDYASSFNNFIHVIVSMLVPIANDKTVIGREAILLLKFIILMNSDKLPDAIKRLHPFPPQSYFEEIRDVYKNIKYKDCVFSLEEEIKYFLKVHQQTNIECRIEGLSFLRNKLSTSRQELKSLYSELGTVCKFSDQCNESSLHSLIYVLKKLASSPDKAVSHEALKCLGEIGPADLRTLILQVERVPLASIFLKNVPVTIAGRLITLLIDLLIDTNFDVRYTAGNIMHIVLKSAAGQAALKSSVDYGNGIIDSSLLSLFCSSQKMKAGSALNIKYNEAKFLRLMDNADIWIPKGLNLEDHLSWITNLICNLLECFDESSFLYHLIPLCKNKYQFSEEVLVLMIEFFMHKGTPNMCKVISKNINKFFTLCWDTNINKFSLECILNVVYFNKLCSNRDHRGDPKMHLDLNYIYLANAAFLGSKYFMCIFFVESFCRQILKNTYDSNDTASFLEQLYRLHPKEGGHIQNILRKAYINIGDTDAVYGCGMSYLLNIDTRTQYYKQTDRFDMLIHYNDINLSNNPSCSSSLHSAEQSVVSSYEKTTLVDSLKLNGLYYLTSKCLSEEDVDYECMWRLGNWNISDTNRNDGSFNKYQYFALKSVKDIDADSMNMFLEEARDCVLQDMIHYSFESCKKYYASLTQLQCLQEIEDFAGSLKRNDISKVLNKWSYQNELKMKDFEYLEPVWSQRITLVKLVSDFKSESCAVLKQWLIENQLKFADLARENQWKHVAKKYLYNLSQMKDISVTEKWKLQLEDARLEWDSAGKSIGRYLLNNVLKNSDEVDVRLQAFAQRLYGSWMSETNWENPEGYFMNSLNIMDSLTAPTPRDEINKQKAYIEYAKYSDEKYKKLHVYISSKTFEKRKIELIKRKELRDSLEMKVKQNNCTIEERRADRMNKSSIDIITSEIEKTKQGYNTYLVQSVKCYLMGIIVNDEYNLSLFRVVSLWLDNSTNEELNKVLDQLLPQVPSYKYLLVLRQLIPHLSDTEDPLSIRVKNIIKRCVVDHPYHTLPLLLGLAHLHSDAKYKTSSKPPQAESRVLGAKLLLAELKKMKELNELIVNTEKVSLALIEFAYHKDVKMNGKLQIEKLKHIENVLMPTYELPISPSGNYKNITGVCRWEKNFSILNGKSKPKKIYCLGTDGRKRVQVLKSNDDLRLDAVMQQVFVIVNSLLKPVSPDLYLRTYKVVPLSQDSGIVEFCENSEPIGSYLVEAHERYHKEDYKPNACFRKLMNAAGCGKEGKLKLYNDICAHLKPALHYFFFEKFGDLTIWWERRRRYIMSVAVNSMVGYVMGIGDRHTSNILIDTNTAEVVHIDFGITFEQGRLLPTPETVPFRLSRDIVDGMGVSGVEGTFRRSCVKTLTILQEKSDTIVSILQVLLYDPSYIWTVSPSKANKVQTNADDINNLTIEDNDNRDNKQEISYLTERVLIDLKEKLRSSKLGIDGQVEQLLQQARDPANLSCLYAGWQSYL